MENIRLRKLRKLISEDFNGSQSALSACTGVSLSQIGQYLGGYRNIGERTARKIELGARKKSGWLDEADDQEKDLLENPADITRSTEDSIDLTYTTATERYILTQWRETTDLGRALILEAVKATPKDSERLKLLKAQFVRLAK